MAIQVYTHDRIKTSTGLLGVATLLYGGHALQTINVTRNTPKQQQAAIGYLGIVDYTKGIITSDVTLDTMLVEAGNVAAQTTNQNIWGSKTVAAAGESYALTSFAIAAAAGSPTTANFGWITPGLASYLQYQVQPATQNVAQYAMVLGDDNNGLVLEATWDAAGGFAAGTGSVPTIMADGTSSSVGDYGLPIGVQSLHMSTNINRDQVLDLRSTRPATFVTTYPIDCSMDLEVYQLPGTAAAITAQAWDTTTNIPSWNHLTGLTLRANTGGKIYASILGLNKQTEGESVSVGRYLSYTVNFKGTELWIPCTPPA